MKSYHICFTIKFRFDIINNGRFMRYFKKSSIGGEHGKSRC